LIIRDCEDEDDEEPLPVVKEDTEGNQHRHKRLVQSSDDEREQTLDLAEVERERTLSPTRDKHLRH
jgi:hypothetical protein